MVIKINISNLSTFTFINETKFVSLEQCDVYSKVFSEYRFLIILGIFLTIWLISTYLIFKKDSDTLLNRFINGGSFVGLFMSALELETLVQLNIVNNHTNNILISLFWIIFGLGIIYCGWQLDKYLKKRKKSK